MVCIENVKSECGPGPVEGGRVPPQSQQLTVMFNPSRTLFASTKLDVNVVSAAEVDDEDLLETRIRGWARCMSVTNVVEIA